MAVWFAFAFLTAIFESFKDVLSKHNLRNFDEYLIAWSLRFFAMPFLLPLLLFIEIPRIGGSFWPALAVSGSINVIATVLYMRAMKNSDLSLAAPMLTFTPLFLLVTSPLIVGEFPGVLGLAGIFLIFAGSYAMNISERRRGFFAPIKSMLHKEGPRLMLFVAFLWSISSNFDKVGIENSSALFWVVSLNIFLVAAMTPLMIIKTRHTALQLRSNLRYIVPIGMFSALGSMAQMTAISIALVAYVISIKRTSAIISVLLGCFLFRERGLKERLTGAIIMVVGVILITLS